ncbi:ethanolamine ammonia-lyase subunit EutC [Luteolibacter flavescens]|uniref:Ethanolamine ammonia-lyase small subunit n=1 Tax=Luteolibacter flavescens TaxID=1859460 RepID=A0ABT3FNN4_9BACT|nr:ethanolamine ammonia-lyase subunit EutC [Luteolibacter flavescens]MCW1884590.1 ethanolamine ammonia-lyase subunit EutC [Luteolibacter flavescens]
MSDDIHPLKHWTSARVGNGRAGGSLPHGELLRFRLDHAKARDAVHACFDPASLAAELEPLGLPVILAHSQAGDRATYLQRPDLGRRLSPESAGKLAAHHGDHDLVIILADGLSATAAHRQGPPLLGALLPLLESWALAPLVIVPFARVALQDEIGHALGARAALILLGERPGLGSPDSLGAYLVHSPRSGNTDARRNCVSNIRPEGLPPAAAARRIAWLLHESRRLGFSGVDLKDTSESAISGEVNGAIG